MTIDDSDAADNSAVPVPAAIAATAEPVQLEVTLIEDERVPDTPEAVIREMEALGLQTAVARLPQRTRHVLVRRYGLDDRKRATLEDLARELGISRERVRQIQLEAESILRTRENRRMLREVVA